MYLRVGPRSRTKLDERRLEKATIRQCDVAHLLNNIDMHCGVKSNVFAETALFFGEGASLLGFDVKHALPMLDSLWVRTRRHQNPLQTALKQYAVVFRSGSISKCSLGSGRSLLSYAE